MLNLMYITNHPEIAQIAESAGVNRIFVDLEYIGKADRQGGMDTVQSHHTFSDVKVVSEAITAAELLVRVNPIHEATRTYCSSEEEVDTVISNGADIVMLPYFKTVEEVDRFLSLVGNRAKTMLLLETPEAVDAIDRILALGNIDFVHIGLNDLSLGYGMKFMFELLADGTVEKLCAKIHDRGIPYGFGGIASVGKGTIPAEMIIKEHYRLGSTCAILSRSFCNTEQIKHLGVISTIFLNGIREIRELEMSCKLHFDYFAENKAELKRIVESIVR